MTSQHTGVPPATQPEAIYQLIGKRLAQLRDSRGITQTQLGFSVGMTRGAIANIEKGRQRIFVHQIYKLADDLGVPIAELLPDSLHVRHLGIMPEAQSSYLTQLRQLERLSDTTRKRKPKR